jgi:hypothetical protein
MNNQYEISGRVINISDERKKEIGYGVFHQRDLVLAVENPVNPLKNHYVKIQFTNETLDMVSGLSEGDMVQVTVTFMGYGWDKEKDGNIAYINMVEGINVVVF